MVNLNEKLTAIIEQAPHLSHFGVRVMNDETDTYEVGQKAPISYAWVDGERTDDCLEGTSTVGIDWDGWDVNDIDESLEQLQQYMRNGHQVVLVGGVGSYEGNDPRERVIYDAEILYIF